MTETLAGTSAVAKKQSSLRRFLGLDKLVFAAIVIGAFYMSGSGCAVAGAAPPPDMIPDGTCTSQAAYEIVEPPAGQGLVSSIIDAIAAPLVPLSKAMFQAIALNPDFQNTVAILASVYVAIYGVLFTFAIVQITVFDFFIRLAKIGILYELIQQSSWDFFNDTVVTFFQNGTDEIIDLFGQIAIGDPALAGVTGNPFAALDSAIVYVVSSKMAITLMAALATGPYGPIIGLLLIMSMGSFLKAIFNALWVYVMALVIRTLLFGLAPLFVGCILFTRTRPLFDGWLNQIVGSSLQPIFLFAFFSFFVMLIKACIAVLLTLPVCWMPVPDGMTGTPFMGHFWRFAIWSCNDGKYIPYLGIWNFNGADVDATVTGCPEAPVNPIGVILPLMLWILADLASRFNHIVIEIAKDLSNASTELRMGGESIKEWFSSIGGGGPGSRDGSGGRTPGSSGTTGMRETGSNPLGALGNLFGGGTQPAAQPAVQPAPGAAAQTGMRPPVGGG